MSKVWYWFWLLDCGSGDFGWGGGRGRDRDRDRDGDRRLPIFGGPGVEDTINVVSASHCLWWTVSRAANCTFSS